MIGFDVRVERVVEVQERLKEMRGDLQYRAINSGLIYAARPVRDSIRNMVPVKTGQLRRSIGARIANTRQKRVLGIDTTKHAIIVGPRTVHGRIANILEGGAKPHDVRARGAGFMVFNGIFAKKIRHPGIKAMNFIGRAQDAALPQMEARFLDGVTRYLDKQDRSARADS